MDDLGSREREEALQAFLSRPAPRRDLDARPHPVMAWGRFFGLVGAALVIIPVAYAATIFQMWRPK
jgi:hypothetical protein